MDENFQISIQDHRSHRKGQGRKSGEIRQKSVVYWSRHFYDRDGAEASKALLEFIEKLKKSPEFAPGDRGHQAGASRKVSVKRHRE
ncbi:MAG: hypothetical protein ACLRT5_09470 [Lachnospiraceae bacterium]